MRSLTSSFRRTACALAGLCAALTVGTSGAQPARAASPIVMKLGTATLNDNQHEWLRRYKAAVERDSKGRIDVQIYPAGQLGSIPREIEGTQFGAIQGWVGPPEFLTGVDARYQVLSAPGVFHSLEQANRTLEDPTFSAAFLAIGADKGLVGIDLFIGGRDSIVTRKPIRRLSDLGGTKIRVNAGPLLEQQMHLLGATAVPMPLDQVAAALQQGAIDGTLANVAVATSQKYYGVAKYLNQLDQPYVAAITVVSKTWFDALPPDLQKIVVDDAQRTGRALFPYTMRFVQDEQKGWTSGGGEIDRLPPSEHAQMDAKLRGVGDAVFASQPVLAGLYHQLLAAAAHAH
jgi:TRAP-type C4-dicarboxylate transport system substrate-binding protein